MGTALRSQFMNLKALVIVEAVQIVWNFVLTIVSEHYPLWSRYIFVRAAS